MTAPAIPNRAVFRAQEVCDLAQVQPYVLRSWEAEFPDLGVSKTPSSPRVYRRADVELVLRLKHLLFVDGLTLAGARRQLGDRGLTASAPDVSDADVAALIDDETRQHLRDVRRGLQWILGVLDGHGRAPDDLLFAMSPPVAPAKKKVEKTEKAEKGRAKKADERHGKSAARGSKRK